MFIPLSRFWKKKEPPAEVRFARHSAWQLVLTLLPMETAGEVCRQALPRAPPQRWGINGVMVGLQCWGIF